jgi:ATP-dependent exoDNAse (exonuclease V) beta subunit
LKTLAEAVGLDLEGVANNPGVWQTIVLPCGQPVGAWALSQESAQDQRDESLNQELETDVNHKLERVIPLTNRELQSDIHLGSGAALYLPLVSPEHEEPIPEEEPDALENPIERPWRATGNLAAPAVVVGDMVHRAIQRWAFPGDPRLDALLETVSLNAGLVDPRQRAQAAREAYKLLQRLCDHPIWSEINNSTERHHEVPYTRLAGSRADTGYIDLLYRTAAGWFVVDFKTDELKSEAGLDAAVIQYRRQMERYTQAVRILLGVTPTAQICFLNYQGDIRLYTNNYPEA